MADNKKSGEASKGDSELANRVAEAITYSKKPQRKIAEELGLSPQAVNKWPKLGYIDKKWIPAFCRSCGVSIEWFLTGEGTIDSIAGLGNVGPRRLVALLEGLNSRELMEFHRAYGEMLIGRTAQDGQGSNASRKPTRFGSLNVEDVFALLKTEMDEPSFNALYQELDDRFGFGPYVSETDASK